MKRVKVKDGCSIHVNGRPYGPGQEVELTDAVARGLVKAGTVRERPMKAKPGVG